MTNILIREKPSILLRALYKQNGKKGINEIGKSIYSTYKSRYSVLTLFEKEGYVSFERGGREVICTLTKKGKEALKHLDFFI